MVDFLCILVFFEVGIVRVLVHFKSQILVVVGLREPICYLAGEHVTAPIFNESLLLLIKDGHVDVLITELREFDRLLDKSSLPFAVSDVTRILVSDLRDRCKFLFAH